jgi:hypothetical protein
MPSWKAGESERGEEVSGVKKVKWDLKEWGKMIGRFEL